MNTANNEHTFAQYVRILGKGKTGTRALTIDEASSAFAMILRSDVEDVQLGAFLMLLRVKEESAVEIAGFVQACRDALPAAPTGLGADLDWSSYAGKRHQHPWFVLSQLLIAEAGYSVLVHGSAGHTPGRLYTEQVIQTLGLPIATNWQQAGNALNTEKLCYMPLASLLPELEALMQLKPLLGLRSPVNTLTRLLNPLAAAASIQSVFHPAYAKIHQHADRLLQQPRALVFKGDSGEAEIKPQADTRLFYLIEGEHQEQLASRTLQGRVARVEQPQVEPLRRLWRGDSQDDYGLAATLGTAATALVLLQPGLSQDQAAKQAAELWRKRNRERLA
ncbi:MAG: glycosyl transferase family protein [Halioglobus sp.]